MIPVNRSKKYVFGNWKMNKDLQQAREYISAAESNCLAIPNKTTVVLFIPYLYLGLNSNLQKNNNIEIGAQNVAANRSGSFTGEISAAMLKSVGVIYCLVGHSERRILFGETDKVVACKLNKLLQNSIIPILCIGETLDQWIDGKTDLILMNQLKKCLINISEFDLDKLIIAYEPIWAIGTGKVAEPSVVESVVQSIRNQISKQYHSNVGEKVVLLYGGSVNPQNIAELSRLKQIDGVLVGGSSLKVSDFVSIWESY